jgi:hypothetical protein
MGAEACALNRDNDRLPALWETYARYLRSAPDKGEFFPQWQRYLVDDLPVAVRLLASPGEPGLPRLLLNWQLRRIWNPSNRARVRRILILLLRLIVFALISSSAIVQLFR